MTNEQYVLMRRMMVHNERIRMPKDERDRAENLRAVRMITLIGCLDYAMLELTSCLEDEGRYVRVVKRNTNKACECVKCMHKEVHDLIHREDGVATRIFSDLRDKNWWSIDDHISIKGVEGAYSVVMSLCRLIEACNASISRRYNYRSVDKLKHVKDMLSVIGAEDKNLDFIIDKAVIVR
jgi:hypothetical protein